MTDFDLIYDEYMESQLSNNSFVYKNPITGEVREGLGEPPLKWGEYPDGIEPNSPEANEYDMFRSNYIPLPHEVYAKENINKIKKMPEGSQITDTNWIVASKILHNYLNRSKIVPAKEDMNVSPSGTAGLSGAEITIPGNEEFKTKAKTLDNAEEYAKWGVNFMSAFDYNIAALAINVSQLNNAPENVLKSMYYLMETADREGMTFSNFTKGLFNVATDPFNLVGLGTLGIGVAGKYTGQQMTKAALKEVLKGIVLSKPSQVSGAVGAEAMLYSVVDNYARQDIKVDAKMQDGIDKGELATSAVAGAVIGERIGAGLPNVIEGARRGIVDLGKQADNYLKGTDDGATLTSGFDVSKPIAKGLSVAGKALDTNKVIKKDVDYLGFYSKALEESKNLKQEKGTGEQFKAMLLKAGVKQDEIEWTGLDELLAKDKVTKKEITDLLEANRVKLNEVEKIGSEDDAFLNFSSSEYNVRLDDLYLADVAKGNDVPDKKLLKSTLTAEEAYGAEYLNNRADEIFEDLDNAYNDPGNKTITEPPNIDDAYNEAVREYWDNPIRIYEATNGYVITGNDDIGYQIFRNKAESSSWRNALNISTDRNESDIPYSLDEAKVQAQNIAEEQGNILFESDAAKYAEHTLAGGDNYREFLLTLDQNLSSDSPLFKKMGIDYYNHHYDEGNIVAHIRVKDRELGDKKVLYIEEIQSDWGQQGRKQGFKPTKEEFQNIQKQIDELNINGRKILNNYTYVRGSVKVPFGDYYLDKIKQSPPTRETFSNLVNLFGNAKASGFIFKDGKKLDASSDAKDAISIMQKISNLEYDKYNSIPKAPFVTDTNKWTTLSIKRILAKASEEGYDAVAITPGSVHVKRWNNPGLANFYDNIIPKIAKKIVGKLDGKITRLPSSKDTDLRDTASGDTFYNMEAFDGALLIDLTPNLKNKTQKGQALFTPTATTIGAGLTAKQMENNQESANGNT